MSESAGVRLLAVDYDGTVAVDGGLPSARVVNAVAEARGRGVRVVLATGRGFRSASHYASVLGLTDPVICYQGGLIRELTGAQVTLWAESLPAAPLAQALQFAVARDLDLGLYATDAVYVTSLRRPREFYDRWFGVPLRFVPDFNRALAQMQAEGDAPVKCLFIGEPAESDRLEVELTAQFAGRLTVVRSHEYFVELIPPTVSKGHALAFLAGRFDVPQAAVMAVGDSGNDISMLRWAGVGVAMGNAASGVKAAADWIAPPVAEDGLVAAIERFVL